MVEYIPCYSAPAEHRGFLPATRLASRIILIEQNNKKRTGPALCVLCGCESARYVVLHVHICTCTPSSLRRGGNGAPSSSAPIQLLLKKNPDNRGRRSGAVTKWPLQESHRGRLGGHEARLGQTYCILRLVAHHSAHVRAAHDKGSTCVPISGVTTLCSRRGIDQS
jgi:hypothetical protein